MPIDFPSGPTTGQVYTYQGKSWVWSGTGWDVVTPNYTFPAPQGNLLINGGFDIWQRGTSGFSGFVYTADRVVNDTASVVSRSTDVPIESGTSYSLRHAATTAAASNRFSVELPRAGYSAPFNTGTSWTLSFYAKASVSRAMTTFISFRNGIAGASEAVVVDNVSLGTASSTWQRFTHTFTVPSVSLTNSNLFSVVVTAAAGASMDFFITGVQLEAGAVATPFKRNAPSIQAELAACQRYYEKSTPLSMPVNTNNSAFPAVGVNIPAIIGQYQGDGWGSSSLSFVVRKRVSPTMTFYNTDGTAGNGSISAGASGGLNTGAAALVSENHFIRQANLAGVAAGAAYVLRVQWEANAEL